MKSINQFFALSIITLFSVIAHADPCSDSAYCYDPDGGSGTITNINNPFHYVFIAPHPDDELMVYPIMKDFCAENNAYCSLIITTLGDNGCDPASGYSPAVCGNIRSAEMKASADYLEADL